MTTIAAPIVNDSTAVPNELWQAALQTMKGRFTRPVYDMWVRSLAAVSLCDGELLLATQNEFTRDWVENRLKSELSDAVSETFGTPVLLSFTVATDAHSTDASDAIAPVPSLPGRAKAAKLNPRYTFAEFITGNANQFAHAAATAVANAPGRAYNPLFLYGGVGLGKTHLLHAIGQRVLDDNPNAQVVYVTCEQFANELVTAVQANTLTDFRSRYRQADVLLIDDVQFLANSERTHEEFFFTFNALHEAGRQVVVASDRAPKEIAALEPRLRSRFEWGLLADVQAPDLETRDAILRRKAEHEGVAVPDAVTAFIARTVTASVRELEGALTRVLAYAAVKQSDVTLEVAHEALKNVYGVMAPRRVTINAIKETVAAAHGITVREMDNGRRDVRLSKPRQIAMLIATELTNYSLPQIAREFGKQDHTTVMYARDKIREQMQHDETFRNRVRQLTALARTAG